MMKDTHLAEPDLAFIADITKHGGADLKKCIQCATCSVACKLSPERQPFPRKEMIYANWGLKDRLLGNPDIWLCYNCGDCSTLCPRGARPGDVLGAIRRLAIKTYSKPPVMGRLLHDARLSPLLLIIPALIILAVGMATGMLDLRPEDGGRLVYAHHFPVIMIEIIFIPLSLFSGLVFFFGIKNLLKDMQTEYRRRGRTFGKPINLFELFKTLINTLPAIIKHDNFTTCSENKARRLSHMLVSFSFIGLASVAGVFVFALYVLDAHAPYSQANPVKVFANLAGVALITGSLLLIAERMTKTPRNNTFFDGYLLLLALFLGITGMFTQFIRLADAPALALSVYFIHLVLAFNLVAFLPYTKLAHFIYRTVAVAYYAYIDKNP
jgi:quinone-modifying oxidoreductase subunit QmoC